MIVIQWLSIIKSHYSGFSISWAVEITWLRDQPRPKPQVLWGKMVGSTEYSSQWLLEVNMVCHELFNSCALVVHASVIHFSSLFAKHIHNAEVFLLPPTKQSTWIWQNINFMALPYKKAYELFLKTKWGCTVTQQITLPKLWLNTSHKILSRSWRSR